MSESDPVRGDDEDRRFWTRERRREATFEGLMLFVRLLQVLLGGG
ncbi:hypothetical protein ACFWNR_39230 [Streptomyces virginiae]